MNKTGSNLLFLAIGAAIGAAVGYVAATDSGKKEEWLRDIKGLGDKIRSATHRGKEKTEELENDVE
jgi:gas vesicle protein